jgi:LacI family transcriptional regulator
VILGGSGLSDASYRDELDARVRSFQGMGGSVVAIGTPVVDVDHVLADNRVGAERLGQYLADLGHRDIAVISGPENVASSVERTEGLRTAFERRGARLLVHHGPPTRDEGYRAAGEILHRHPEVTAIVGTADQMAIGASARIRAQGLSVPSDISVAGFNDIAMAADLSPSLTTVRLPLRAMGRTALELALMEPGDDRVEHTFGVELVVRESTGRPPQH